MVIFAFKDGGYQLRYIIGIVGAVRIDKNEYFFRRLGNANTDSVPLALPIVLIDGSPVRQGDFLSSIGGMPINNENFAIF